MGTIVTSLLFGLLSCRLTQPLSLCLSPSPSVFCSYFPNTSSSNSVHYSMYVTDQHWGIDYLIGGYTKLWDSLEAVETFLKLFAFLTDKLFSEKGGG